MPDTSSEIFEHVLAMRDLTDPFEFLVALYFAEGYPNPPPLDEARFERDIEVVERYHAHIFNKAGRARSALATRRLLDELAPSRRTLREHVIPRIPREWLAVFRLAFAQGLINRIVFGAAVHQMFVVAVGNATPALPGGSSAAMLQDVRQASPLGMMSPLERQEWRALPDTVTAYRGGAISAGAPADARARAAFSGEGLFWTPNIDYAGKYLARRRRTGTRAAALGSIPALQLGFSGLAHIGYRPKGKVVTPYIVRAEIPRELVLAHWHVDHIMGDQVTREVEIVVDYEKVTPAMITDVTPEHELPRLGVWAA